MIGVEWAIDGRPVPLVWSDAPMSAPGGYGNLGEVSTPVDSWPVNANIFSTVVGTRTDGKTFYVGEIAGPPTIYQGVVRFTVQGIRERLARKRGRRLYQNQGLDNWVTADSDPHSAGVYTMSDAMAAVVKDGSIVFQRHTDESFTTNDAVSVLFWAGEETITRTAFDIDRTIGHTDYDIELTTSAGPDGVITLESPDYVLTGTTQINVDKTLDTPNNQLGIRFRANSTHGPSVRNTKVRVRKVRVNGRTLSDTFTLSELGADLAAEMEWDDLSPESAFNILPQDWLEDWTGALTGAAELCDCTWLVLPPTDHSDNIAGLYVGDWGRNTWTLRGADYSDLHPLVVYNKAIVGFETPGGVTREVTADAATDPYAGSGLEVVWPPDGPYQLGDRQYDSTQATAAATALIGHYSTPRVAGQIEVARIWASDGEAHPWDIDAGDLVRLADYEVVPGADPLPAQRVIEVTRRRNGTAVISVGEATSLASLLEDLPQRKRRRRKKRKHGNRRITGDGSVPAGLNY